MLLAALLLSTALPFVDPLDLVQAALDFELAPPRLVQEDAGTDDVLDGGAKRKARGGTAGTSGAPTPGAAGSAATPQGRPFGVGLQLGYPTALTIKYMLRADQGVAAGIGGFSGFAYDAGAFSLHVDYLYHPHVLTSGEAFVATLFIGVGANITVFNNARQRAFLPGVNYFFYPTSTWLGVRVPMGVSLAMRQQPIEIYLEATPQLLIFPGVSFGLGAALGARFYF